MWDNFSSEAKRIITNWVLGDQVSPAVRFAPFPSSHKPTKPALCPPVCHPTHPPPAPSRPSPASVNLHSMSAAKFLGLFADLSVGRDETTGSLETNTHQGQQLDSPLHPASLNALFGSDNKNLIKNLKVIQNLQQLYLN